MNRQIDVELIQYYLSAPLCGGYLSVPGVAPELACSIAPGCGLDADDVSALRTFQAKMGIKDSKETALNIVKLDDRFMKTGAASIGNYRGAGKVSDVTASPPTFCINAFMRIPPWLAFAAVRTASRTRLATGSSRPT